jgi:hypothetical protein
VAGHLRQARLGWAIVSVALLSCPAAAATLTFDYGSLALGTVTPFAQTAGGVTANFRSDQDPGGFEVDPSAAFTFSGRMIDTSFAAATLATELVIAFSSPIEGISLPFLTDGAGPLDLQAFSPGGTLSGGTSVSGTVPPFPAVFPEGVITFDANDIGSVTLTDPSDPGFAIGALTVTLPSGPTGAPEPSGLGILAAGLAALGVCAAARDKWTARNAACRSGLPSLPRKLGSRQVTKIIGFPLARE